MRGLFLKKQFNGIFQQRTRIPRNDILKREQNSKDTREMNLDFSERCAVSIIALSICFPLTCALLDNELSAFPIRSNATTTTTVLKEQSSSYLLSRNDYSTSGLIELENKENCTSRSIYDFPADLFTYEQRRHGAVALHAFLGFYCFLLTAFVCHDYLLPAVHRICIGMNISTDVAGATFLAMASSFPEMFVNLIGTFLTESDLGAGTVVGSAVFDTFATPACGALVALHSIQLKWQILSRDCIMYVISVGTLVIIMWDRQIRWYEASILLVFLCFYLILLFCGEGIMLCCSKIGRCNFEKSTITISSNKGSTYTVSSYQSDLRNDAVVAKASSTTTTTSKSYNVDVVERQQNESENVGNSEKSEKRSMYEYLFTWPRGQSTIAKCWFMVAWPLKFLLFATIPDIRVERFKHWYPLSFIMCTIWIAISSYLVSWMMTAIGDTIGIPDSVMGLTFLAAGGNMPEIASIVILARQGDGNMAMSNTLGANILDILLCLGLPWTIKCLISGRDVTIDSGALTYSILSMVICIVILFAVIAFYKFQLNKKVGCICLLLYMIFLVFTILVELNVFFFVNSPMCD